MPRVIIMYAVIVLIVAGLFYWFGIKNNASPESNTNGMQSSSDVSITVDTGGQTKKMNVETVKNLIDAVIKISKGDIELALYPDAAPKTVANFVEKAKAGFYNNLKFHRVEDWVIQGGDPLGNGTGGGSMPTELNDRPFTVGALGVARGGDIKISNDAQFFIVKSDALWLNKQYTNFGAVVNGMDVVRKIKQGDVIQTIIIK